MPGLQLLQTDSASLPLAPRWRVERDYVLDRSAGDLVAELAALAEGEPHYWVLQQGPLAPGSKRQSLLNLDSDTALAAALTQTFHRPNPPDALVFQCLPPQRAAGVLFTRHPLRPDLDHIVVEGRANEAEQQRLILHADGSLAWHSGDENGLLLDIGAAPFHQLARALDACSDGPRAAEWVWDGERLWLVQALPIGTLPMPAEVWTRRAGLGFSNQVISPLWYTTLGRWLKQGFWRRVGRRAHWEALHNVEPYRRQHSHLYGNAQFFRALQGWQRRSFLWWALPPAWREVGDAGGRFAQGRMLRWWYWWQLRLLGRGLRRLEQSSPEAGHEELWLQLMQLDRLGEQLASVEGWLGYVVAPQYSPRGDRPRPDEALDRATRSLLADLGQVARETLDWDAFRERHRGHSVGADPVFPRCREASAGTSDLDRLKDSLGKLSAERVLALIGLNQPRKQGGGWLALRLSAAALRRELAARLRRVLGRMAERLVAQGLLRHPDDIFFLYFDELWQAWQGTARRGLGNLLGERKVRYLSDAHAGPPDWIIDSVGYGASPLGQSVGRETVRGFGLVSGKVRGRVQRIGSGWQLNQVQPGDILVLDQSDVGWLPWVATAAGLVLAHRDPLDPAAALACALKIPTVWGVDDAMHCLIDGETIELDGESGRLEQHPA